jgi:outer membrane protein TolC
MNETERMLPARHAPVPAAERERWPFDGSVRRARIVAGVLANDPELTALQHRARALLHAARAEAALPSPEIDAEVWSLPVGRGIYAFGEASMYMVGVRQMLPALAALDARARASIEEARAVIGRLAVRERELTRMTIDAYADLVGAVLHHRVHHAQLELLVRMLDVAHARYSAGGSALTDVSRLEVERAREARALTRFDADAVRARATLNTLLHRAPDAPIGTPEDLEAETVSLAYDDLVARVDRARGEVQASEARVRAAEARVRAQEADANVPAFTFGLSYMQDPMRDPGLGLAAAMTMPWLTVAGRARVAQAREEAEAERAMTEGARWTARREIAAAQAQLASAERVLRIVRAESLPAAARSLDAVRGSYVTGDADLLQWLDASRTALEFAMDEADAIADLVRAAGALESAVGEPLPRTPVRVDGEGSSGATNEQSGAGPRDTLRAR